MSQDPSQRELDRPTIISLDPIKQLLYSNELDIELLTTKGDPAPQLKFAKRRTRTPNDRVVECFTGRQPESQPQSCREGPVSHLVPNRALLKAPLTEQLITPPTSQATNDSYSSLNMPSQGTLESASLSTPHTQWGMLTDDELPYCSQDPSQVLDQFW
jgi:hypothetical protein